MTLPLLFNSFLGMNSLKCRYMALSKITTEKNLNVKNFIFLFNSKKVAKQSKYNCSRRSPPSTLWKTRKKKQKNRTHSKSTDWISFPNDNFKYFLFIHPSPSLPRLEVHQHWIYQSIICQRYPLKSLHYAIRLINKL